MGRWQRSIRAAALACAGALALASCSVLDLLPGRQTSEVPAEPSSSAPASTAPVNSPTPGQSADSIARGLVDRVSQDDLVGRLQQLQDLTLAADGNRGPASEGYLAAAEWIESELEATGFYEVRREPFTIHLPHPGESRLVDGSGRVINERPLTFSPGTPDEGVSGRLVVANTPNGCSADAWDDSIKGQIGLVDRGECTFQEKVRIAAAAGAVALLIANHADGGMYGTLDFGSDEFIPTTGITRSEGARLRDEAAAGEVQLTYTFDQRIETFETFNLFAETTGGAADNVVMVGAHLDSVPEGPGVNDNGSGSVILLETALELAAGGVQPTNKVRFAWWSGEEWGLLGAMHWVNQQVANDPEMINDIAAYVNVDMVASPNYVIGVYDGDGSTFPDAEMPPGSDKMEQLYTSYFDSIGQPWVDVEMGGSSDHAAFVASGVPVGGLFTGAGDQKTDEEEELFGGESGRAYDENYHQFSDTMDKLSPEALAINGKASAYVAVYLAFDSSPVNGPDGAGNDGTPTPAQGYGYAGTS